jgi:electron transport complex protein RnfC
MSAHLTFPKGGVHPPEAKELTQKLAVETMPLPAELELILGQHIGAPCTPVVKRKEEVAEGDLLAETKRGLGVPLHAPAAGSIKAVGRSPHPIRVSAPSITIKTDPEAHSPAWEPAVDWHQLSSEELLQKVHQAGIIGIGGAGFPTHVKLKPPADTPVDTLLLNGAECEPYITADHRMMLEKAEEIVEGAKILLKILGIKACAIGIEENKPDAISTMEAAVQKAQEPGITIGVETLKVKYPQGSEKQLIQAITGRKVPALALPSAVGVVVHNV